MYWLLFHNASKPFYIINLLVDEFEVRTVNYEIIMQMRQVESLFGSQN